MIKIVQLYLFAEDMILYLKETKQSNKQNYQEGVRICDFTKFQLLSKTIIKNIKEKVPIYLPSKHYKVTKSYQASI